MYFNICLEKKPMNFNFYPYLSNYMYIHHFLCLLTRAFQIKWSHSPRGLWVWPRKWLPLPLLWPEHVAGHFQVTTTSHRYYCFLLLQLLFFPDMAFPHAPLINPLCKITLCTRVFTAIFILPSTAQGTFSAKPCLFFSFSILQWKFV